MKKYKVLNFVDYLSKSDIKTVLGLMGYRLIQQDDNEGRFKEETFNSLLKKRLVRDNDNEEHKILCVCKKLTKDELEQFKISLPKELATNLIILATAFGFHAMDYYTDIRFVTIENFFAYETLCPDMNDEDIFRHCTDVLETFMSEKFGSFYKSERKKYINNLRKEVEKEEAEKSEKEEQENESEAEVK